MSETHRPRRILRRIGAVLAGVLVVVIPAIATDFVLQASGIFPPAGERMPYALLVLATIYRSIYAIAGSYVAARLAPDRPMWHALVLGVIGLAVCTLGAVATWNGGPAFEPKWYPLALIATAMPCAWAGGRLYGTHSRPLADG